MRVINFIPDMPDTWDGETAPWRSELSYCWSHLAMKNGRVDMARSVPGEDRPYNASRKELIKATITELANLYGRDLVVARRPHRDAQHLITEAGTIDPSCINVTLREVAIVNGYGDQPFSLMVYQGTPVYAEVKETHRVPPRDHRDARFLHTYR